MEERYRGVVLVASVYETPDERFRPVLFVREDLGRESIETRVNLQGIESFATQQEAIEVALQAGRREIDRHWMGGSFKR